MAKYCTNCGKPLVDGQECNCKREVKIDGEASKVDLYMKELWETIKGIFTKPVDTIKSFVKKEDIALSVIILIVQSILIGILAIFLFRESFSIRFFTYEYQLGSAAMFYRVFFMTVFKILIASFFVALVFQLMTERLSNSKIDYKKMVALLAVTSIISIVTLLVGFVLFNLSLKLMLVVFLLGFLFMFVTLFQGLKIVTRVDENKQGYLFVGGISLTVLFIIYVLPILF